MAALIVAYDLKKIGQNYTCITTKLSAYKSHWHMQGSVWIVITNETTAQLRDKLMQCLDQNDELFVARLSEEAAWVGYADNVSKWLLGVLAEPVR